MSGKTSWPQSSAPDPPPPSPARRWAEQATITIEDAAIRVTFDGTTPVDATDIGHVFSAGTVLTLESQTQIERFKAVRNGGTNAVINVTYWEG